MNIKTSSRTNVSRLSQEVGRLRSALVSILGEDSEGAYRPEFVKSILALNVEKPTKKFTTAKAFLEDLRQV